MPISKAIDELPSLSDQDVELLGSIVFAAEKIVGPPFRALFTAYDQVLAEHGIPPGTDQTYFRFLLRMGEEHNENDSLFGRFKSLLERTGIRVEIDRNEDHVEGITRQAQDAGSQNAPETPQKTRRASFDSAFDHLTDGERQDDVFKDAASTYHEQQQQRPSSRVSRLIAHPSPGFQFTNAPRSLFGSAAHRGRLNSRTVSEQFPIRSRRQTSISSQGSLRITRRYGRDTIKRNEAYSADESEGAEPDMPVIGQAQEYESLKTVSHADQLRDATSFRLREVHHTARRCLLLWRQRTAQSSKKSESMVRSATEHDRHALLRSGFGIWVDKHQTHKQDIETEKFFEHMERRADRARNLFLLTKAFTHWAQSASDEVNRTSIARRHILRTRYFNAWRDITAVNALKVRRQGLRKFMGIWRDRTAALVDNQIKALVHYEDNMTERIYWRWFWAFCARRAPLWGNQRTKQHYFVKWLGACDRRQRQEQEATKSWDRKIVTRALALWHSAYTVVQAANTAADSHRNRSLVTNTFQLLRKKAQLQRPTFQLHHSTDDRLIRGSFNTWLLRVRQVRQAEAWAVQRVLQRAMTNWKCRMIILHINERLVVQSLYQWMLAARVALIARVHDAANKKACLEAWRARAISRKNELERLQNQVKVSSRRRLLQRIVDLWSNRARVQQQNHEIANSFRNDRLASSQLFGWTARLQHIHRLEQWATDAHFYVSASHTLSTWKAAMQASKKQKRRETYAQVRRANKMALARRMLRKWHDSLNTVETAEHQADEIQGTKLIQSATRYLKSWQNGAQNAIRMSHQAEDFYQRKIKSHVLQQWVLRLKNIEEIQAMGNTLEAEMNARNFRMRLKELSAKYFRIESQKDTADKFQARNFRKHRRDMLRYWKDQAVQRFSTGETTFATGLYQQENEAEDEDEDEAVKRNENWTALDASALDHAETSAILEYNEFAGNEGLGSAYFTSTPRAGYHRTPSKTPAARTRELLEMRQRTLHAAPRIGAFATETAGPLSMLSRRVPASAPNPSFVNTASVAPISSFTRRLQAQGISANIDGEGPSRPPIASRLGRRGKASVGFTGFDDIQEDERTEREDSNKRG